MKITFFGTTTLLFDDGSDQLLFDAHFTRPSLLRYIFGSAATDQTVVNEMLGIHRIDRLRAIFISHSHHDHVMDAPYTANQCNALIYGSGSALNVARGGNVPESRLVEFKGNETYEVGNVGVQTICPARSMLPSPVLFRCGKYLFKQTMFQPHIMSCHFRIVW